MSDGWSTHYYELPPDAKELQDLIEHRNMNFAVANIFKACYRLGAKDGTSETYDINKIIWFAQRELARLEKENKNNDDAKSHRSDHAAAPQNSVRYYEREV